MSYTPRLLTLFLAALLLPWQAGSDKTYQTDSTNRIDPPVVDVGALVQQTQTLEGLVEYHSFRAGVDPRIVRAVIHQESGGDSLAVNPNDPSYGLGQVMPRYWRHAFVKECGDEATPETLMRPDLNVCYTAHILGTLTKRYGSEDAALSHYNTGGPTNGRRYAAAVRQLAGDKRALPPSSEE